MKKVLLIVICLFVLSLTGCSQSPSPPPPSINYPSLTEGLPTMPPRVTGSTTLAPYGNANDQASSEHFYLSYSEMTESVMSLGKRLENGEKLTPEEQQQYITGLNDFLSKQPVIDIVVKSDTSYTRFDKNEAGTVNFNLSCDLMPKGAGGFSYDSEHGFKLLYDNAQTSINGQQVYTTHLRLRVEPHGDIKSFYLHLANYDPRQSHTLSWEIYVWE
jgi:hypothetical protein